MKKIILLSLIFSNVFIKAIGGDVPQIGAVVKMIVDLRNAGNDFRNFSIANSEQVSEGYYKQVKDAFTSQDEVLFMLDHSSLSDILDQGLDLISLNIPVSPDKSYTVFLEKENIFTDDFKLENEEGTTMENPHGLHYRGMIEDDENSLVAISIFENEIMGFISSTSDGNYIIGKLDGENPENIHVVYNEQLLSAQSPIKCDLDADLNVPSSYGQSGQVLTMINKCVRIYLEVNNDIYQSKGSGTASYVTGAFNQMATLYHNEDIWVQLSKLLIWTGSSPYTSSTISGLLTQFQATRTSFNGDLGELLGYGGGGGKAAGFSGICNSSIAQRECYAGITSSYSTVPTYSWTIEVMTHELGHLFGSRHTHACVWNGNNTAIDGCGPVAGYPYEGTCSGAPIPSTGGTIMSYCHLNAVGLNFNNGFGTQPGNVIRNSVTNATCLCVCASTFVSPVTSICNSSGNTVQGYSISSLTTATSYSYSITPAASPAYFQVNSLHTYTANVMSFNLVIPAGNYSFVLNVQPNGSSCTAPTTSVTVFVSTGLKAATNIYWQATSSAPCPAYKIMCTAIGGAIGYDWCSSMTCSNNCYAGAGHWITSTNYSGHILTNCDGGYAYHVKVNNACGVGNPYCKIVNIPCNHGCPVRIANPYSSEATSVDGKNVIIQIIPNPADNSFSVLINSQVEDISYVKLINMEGKEVDNMVVSGTNVNFNASDLAQGLYTIVVTTASGSTVKKVQIVH